MTRAKVIFVDVDDTLVRSVGTKRIPMPGVVDAIRALSARGAQLYLWSSGGADYARTSAAERGIEDLFSGFLPKPDVYVDDQSISSHGRMKRALDTVPFSLSHFPFSRPITNPALPLRRP